MKKMRIKALFSGALLVSAFMFTSVSNVRALDISSTFTNLDFDASTQASGPAFQGFDGLNGSAYDVPGWEDYGTITDAGTEQEGVGWWKPYEGYAAFVQVGNGAKNLSDHTIVAGEEYTLTFVGKSWDYGGSEVTVTLFYDNPTNVIGTYVTPLERLAEDHTVWAEFTSPVIPGTAASVGGKLGIAFLNTAEAGFGNLDEFAVRLDPFEITVSPTGVVNDPNQTISATIENRNSSTFVRATMFLDNVPVDQDNSGTGTSRTLSYDATNLSLGTHNCRVIAESSTESMTNSWSFEIAQPPFGDITGSPTGWITTDSFDLQATIIENFSIVSSAELYLDGDFVTSVLDRSAAPTTTVTAAVSGMIAGSHTGMVVVAGSPQGTATNTWIFNVWIDDTSKPITALHHWGFNETSGTNVVDDVGGANGNLIGTNYAWTGESLQLIGGSSSSGSWDGNFTNLSAGSYVDLPNGIISALGNAVTFEAVYMVDNSDNWQRLWDFGVSAGGENFSNGGVQNLFFTPTSGFTTARLALNGGGDAGEFLVHDAPEIVTQKVHVAVTYDVTTLESAMFINGQLVDANLEMSAQFQWSQLNDVNNWIGRAQYNDPMFDGQIYDMTIYEGIMTSEEAAARYEALVGGGGGPTVDPDIQAFSVAGGMANLTFVSETGVSYSILRKTTLTGPTWTVVKSGIAGSDPTTSDSVAVSGANEEFYKVEGQ